MTGTAMTAHVRGGRATTLSETITGYLRHDQSWWEPASGGWQRITDPATDWTGSWASFHGENNPAAQGE